MRGGVVIGGRGVPREVGGGGVWGGGGCRGGGGISNGGRHDKQSAPK